MSVVPTGMPQWMETLYWACSPAAPEDTPALLTPVDAVSDFAAWLDDPREYSDSHRQGWTSSMRDVNASLRHLGPDLNAALAAEVSVVLASIAGLGQQLSQKGTVASAAVKAAVEAQRPAARAGVTALQARFGDRWVISAAWSDLIEACRDPSLSLAELVWRRSTFWSLIGAASLEVEPLGSTLRQVLADSAIEVLSLRARLGDVPAPESGEWPSPDSNAELTEPERLELCERALTLPTRVGHNVVWLAFDDATMNNNAISVGPITFYEGRWVQEQLANDPRAALLPAELADLQPHVDPGWLPRGQRLVLVRVDLGDYAVARAVATAKMNSDAIVAQAALRAGRSRWRLLDGHLHLLDGRWIQTTTFASEGDRPIPWPGDQTEEMLMALDAEIGSELPVSQGLLAQAMEAVHWLRAAEEAGGASSVFLNVRVIELIASWVSDGRLEWGNYLSRYRRASWARGQLLNTLYDQMWTGLQDVVYHDGVPPTSHAEMASIAATVLEYGDAGRHRFKLVEGMTHLSRVSDLYDPVGHVGRGLRALAEVFSSAANTTGRLDALDGEFDLLAGRTRRCRNAVAHGGPLVPSTVNSVQRFARSLARSSLELTIRSVVNHRDAITSHDEIAAKNADSRAKLRRGRPAVSALF